MDKPIKIRLHVLSPIHIGCDDIYEPTCFVIDEQKKKLIEFDPLEFVKNLKNDERDKLNKIASSDNLLDIFKTIKRFYKPTIKGREVEITDYLVNHYKNILKLETFNMNAVINQFTINKTAYNPQDNSPYIPGTSLKGALRTAYLSALANIKKISDWKSKADFLETKLLDREDGKNKMSSDPFRMVKVSDLLPVGKVKTKILYAINKKKQKSDKTTLAEKGGVYQIFEVIQPSAVFEGMLNINSPLESSGIKMPIIANRLMASLNKFYVPLLENEINTLKNINFSVPLINKINSNFKGKINKTAFLVRLGRHSGAEAVTIEGNRNIKIMQGKNKPPKYLDHATTIWLASDEPRPQNTSTLLPFGWAVIEVIDAF